MQRMEMLLSKTPPTDVKNDVLPMIYRALESETTQIQELCLSIIPGFAGKNKFTIILKADAYHSYTFTVSHKVTFFLIFCFSEIRER
jgi:hypothetical protein